MKKYLLVIAIVLISVFALFAETFTITYTVNSGTDEDFTYGENCWSVSNGYYTNEYYRTISSSHETWSDTYPVTDPNAPPALSYILSFFLTRDETSYTITRSNTENDITITINCGDSIPDDPPMHY